MRHRKTGRTLGRNPKHQRALLRNLAAALFLTERNAEGDNNTPKVRGRIVTTLAKAKEVRPLVERCITIARRALPHIEAAESLATDADRYSDAWREWRQGTGWQEWNRTMAPALAARRRCLRLLGDRQAVKVLFDDVAPRYVDRPGGYTRILRLAKPRLGDAGTRAILQLVGEDDARFGRRYAPALKPSFEAPPPAAEEEEVAVATEEEPSDAPAEDIADEEGTDEGAGGTPKND